jgi:hypothetical protein
MAVVSRCRLASAEQHLLPGGKDREQKRCLAHFCCTATIPAADWQTSAGLSMIPKKPAPDVIRGGHRFSEMIMLQQ